MKNLGENTNTIKLVGKKINHLTFEHHKNINEDY